MKVFFLIVGLLWLAVTAANIIRGGWRFGRLWGLVFGGIITIIGLAAPAGTHSVAVSGTTVTKAAAPKTAAQPVTAAVIGDTVTISPWAYRINTVSTATTVGDTAFGLGDTASGQYVIVSVSVADVGKKAGTLDATMMELADSAGNSYSYDVEATTDINPAGNDFFLQTVNPGVTDTGQIAYDVPATLDPSTLRMQVSNGILATHTAYIALHS